MTIQDQVSAWLDLYGMDGLSVAETARRLSSDGVPGKLPSLCRCIRVWRGGNREGEPPGDDRETAHDTSDRYIYEDGEYAFTIKRVDFTADEDEVQKWCRWYVHDGARLTQRAVSRMALQVDERILTVDFVRRIFKVLGIDKGSPPFAPHMLARHTPEELAKLRFAMAQADTEAAIRASESDEWRKLYRKEAEGRVRAEDLLDKIADRLPSCDISIHVRPVRFDDRLEPYSPIVVLSDWHVGALVRMGATQYDHRVFRRRIEMLRRELDEWFLAYRRPIDHVHVAICGDMLDGPLGNMRPGQQAEQDLHYDDQVEAAAVGLVEVLGHLRGLVGDTPITSHAVAGNHGRAGGHSSEDPRRLPELLLYRLCEAMTSGIDVVWDRSSEVIHEWRVYSTQVLQTHGDRAPKGLDRVLRAMLDKSAQSHLLVRGHRHSVEVVESHDALGWQCGTLMGDTEYGLHQLGLGARPSQSIIEVRRDGPRVPGTLLVA